MEYQKHNIYTYFKIAKISARKGKDNNKKLKINVIRMQIEIVCNYIYYFFCIIPPKYIKKTRNDLLFFHIYIDRDTYKNKHQSEDISRL